MKYKKRKKRTERKEREREGKRGKDRENREKEPSTIFIFAGMAAVLSGGAAMDPCACCKRA
jgi:hypothetical protein